MFASLRIKRKPLRLKTETQIGDGGRFSKAYQGLRLAVKNLLLTSSASPFKMYFDNASFCSIALNKNIFLSFCFNTSKFSFVKKEPFTSTDFVMHGNKYFSLMLYCFALD